MYTGMLRLISMAEPIHEITKMEVDCAIYKELDRVAQDTWRCYYNLSRHFGL